MPTEGPFLLVGRRPTSGRWPYEEVASAKSGRDLGRRAAGPRHPSPELSGAPRGGFGVRGAAGSKKGLHWGMLLHVFDRLRLPWEPSTFKNYHPEDSRWICFAYRRYPRLISTPLVSTELVSTRLISTQLVSTRDSKTWYAPRISRSHRKVVFFTRKADQLVL